MTDVFPGQKPEIGWGVAAASVLLMPAIRLEPGLWVHRSEFRFLSCGHRVAYPVQEWRDALGICGGADVVVLSPPLSVWEVLVDPFVQLGLALLGVEGTGRVTQVATLHGDFASEIQL